LKSDVSSPWVGNAATSGERVCLDHCELRSGTFVLGIGASEMATTISFACDEAGLRTLVLDLDGYASERISGSIPAFSPSAFLYETMVFRPSSSLRHTQSRWTSPSNRRLPWIPYARGWPSKRA
jgi:hypothetical protein